MKKNVKKRRRINPQKIFCFVSFVFLFSCVCWYGGRLIYFYQDSKKTITQESNTFARMLKTQNHDKETFKSVNQAYYFYGDTPNNYVRYSNMMWRVFKVNSDNSVVLVTDSVIGTLAYGDSKISYKDSSILKWLNQIPENEESGILESKLNDKEKYLVKNQVCTDVIDNVDQLSCKSVVSDYYLGLLSVEDYIYTGSNKGFIHNERYSYLANQNKKHEIWYINNEGKLDVSNGNEILGIKATITLSPTLEIKSGTGTKEDPYSFEDSNGMFASYVQLDQDLWRVYSEQNGILQLVADQLLIEKDTTKNNATITNQDTKDKNMKYAYSKQGYYHNDTVYGSLAYYLNKTYLQQLSYKNIILENKYTNGFYGEDNQYNYEDILKQTIDTKVAVPSIGDIILNDTLNGYFVGTGISQNSSLVYVIREKGIVSSKNVTAEAYVLPCISISKDNLKIGTGTIQDPYRTE